jgi:hypothetical protein
MNYWSFEALNQDLEQSQKRIRAGLYLSRYATLEPANLVAEEFLRHLEEEGYLPPTVAYKGDSKKIRLFLAPDGASPLSINCNGMALELRTGGDNCTICGNTTSFRIAPGGRQTL